MDLNTIKPPPVTCRTLNLHRETSCVTVEKVYHYRINSAHYRYRFLLNVIKVNFFTGKSQIPIPLPIPDIYIYILVMEIKNSSMQINRNRTF